MDIRDDLHTPLTPNPAETGKATLVHSDLSLLLPHQYKLSRVFWLYVLIFLAGVGVNGKYYLEAAMSVEIPRS
jgi:hypothetical protein